MVFSLRNDTPNVWLVLLGESARSLSLSLSLSPVYSVGAVPSVISSRIITHSGRFSILLADRYFEISLANWRQTGTGVLSLAVGFNGTERS